jgi:hypothetical protein
VFARSPVADIGHLLTSAPVDIDRLARQLGPVRGESRDAAKASLSAAERRYRTALTIARHRLIGQADIRASTDHYLIELINHHARSIMLPRDLVRAAAAGASAARLAETFEVPLDAAERRLRDSDIRETLVKPLQKASR